MLNSNTEYRDTLSFPSSARYPPTTSVAVNPNKIATLIIGIKAAESLMAS